MPVGSTQGWTMADRSAGVLRCHGTHVDSHGSAAVPNGSHVSRRRVGQAFKMQRHKKATCRDIIDLGETVREMAQAYSIKRKGEFFYDALLFGLLRARYPNASRQLKLRMRPGQARAQRIDFRLGGTNPTVIELAHGSRRMGLGPSSNRSELQKLCRQRKARTRFLLLSDTSDKLPAVNKEDLQSRYKAWNPGRGRFDRLTVQVIYARRDHSFVFPWKARKG
jgi:hypothetical protein